MRITIQQKSEIQLAGIRKLVSDNTECPEVWQELFARYSPDELSALGNGRCYGVCLDASEADRIVYMAGFDVKQTEAAEEMGLSVLKIDKAEYAVVEIKGRVPDCIREGFRYIMADYFPENNFRHGKGPDLEVYAEGDMESPEYEMELWIPVEKG
jgi:AraC family transcriptional regulator